jgi:type IV pilus modification protein PilV
MNVMNTKAANLKGLDDGFTLIEVMIAIAVLTIGILGVMAMQVHSIDGNASAMRRTRALTLSQDAIERIMSAPFSSFAVGTTSSTNESYTIDQLVEVLPASALTATDALRVTVTARWTEGGIQRTLPLVFIKSQNMENSYVPE